MKTLKNYLLAATMCLALLSSCGKKRTTVTVTGDSKSLENGAVMSGEITSNTTLTKGNTYVLKGGVHVKNGATLTIEEGVTVKSDPNEPTTAYLLIEPGSKINAVGTAELPIVFTSGKATPQEQDWGGVILCGRAPINVTGGTTQSEMGAGVTYGGTDAQDNSGRLSYVRVEYTGKVQTPTKEHNGFTFEGVGAGTQVDHICSYRGGDDGIEFFGGTVNVKYAVVYGAQDDLFDWTYGWTGKAQFLVGIQNQDNGVADRGIEADNNGDNNSLMPFSDPILSNVTLIGSSNARTGDDPTKATETGKTIAMKLRAGTRAHIYNTIATGFSNGINIEHDQTLMNVADGSLVLSNNVLNNPNPWKFTANAGSTMQIPANPYLSMNGTDSSFITSLFLGTTTNGAKDTKSIDAWFDAVNYIGAVNKDNNFMTQAWVKIK